MDHHLSSFVAHARKQGMDHQTIRDILKSNGWKDHDILEALSSSSLDMAVPLPPDRGSAKEAFFHLLSFASLITTIVSVIVILFQCIDWLLPDVQLDGTPYMFGADYYGYAIRWSIACIIVSFPLFLWTAHTLLKSMRAHPEQAVSGVRRWLTFITLFIAATALVSDGTVIVFSLLQGDLTLRFLLKAASILLLAGMTFTYYFLSLKPEYLEKKKESFHVRYRYGTIAAVLLTVLWGFWVAGGPVSVREQRLDENRLQDLRNIHSEIQYQITDGQPWSTNPNGTVNVKHPLPNSLQAIQDNPQQLRVDITDPETSMLYEYKVFSSASYELCATFTTERRQDYDVFWDHPAARQCYTFQANQPTK